MQDRLKLKFLIYVTRLPLRTTDDSSQSFIVSALFALQFSPDSDFLLFSKRRILYYTSRLGCNVFQFISFPFSTLNVHLDMIDGNFFPERVKEGEEE